MCVIFIVMVEVIISKPVFSKPVVFLNIRDIGKNSEFISYHTAIAGHPGLLLIVISLVHAVDVLKTWLRN